MTGAFSVLDFCKHFISGLLSDYGSGICNLVLPVGWI